MDRYCLKEHSRGRMETRTVDVYKITSAVPSGWVGLSSFIRITRVMKSKNSSTKEIAYFISSLSPKTPAKIFQEGIRHHWRIENSLHYIKDVTFGEDRSRIRTGQAPENMSLIRNIVLNLFRVENFTNMAQAIRIVAHDIQKMWSMLIA